MCISLSQILRPWTPVGFSRVPIRWTRVPSEASGRVHLIGCTNSYLDKKAPVLSVLLFSLFHVPFLFLFSFLLSLFSFRFSRFFWLRVPFLPAQGLVGPGRPDFDLYLRGLSSERFNASFLHFFFLEIVIKNTKFETKFFFF